LFLNTFSVFWATWLAYCIISSEVADWVNGLIEAPLGNGRTKDGFSGQAPLSKEHGSQTMKAALTDVLKAGIAMVAGWTVAGWMLFVLVGLFGLIS
jgi:hypothetical protein